ncbi:MAG TPA: hypothetical protein VGY76_07955 [Solirubrobacteraceae bacterium]|jgi:hypothetical protein|nr:hypothetical protein [Solirubrobacteraceae bacterium]
MAMAIEAKTGTGTVKMMMVAGGLRRGVRRVLVAGVLGACVVGVWCAPAWAEGAGAGWEVTSTALPTNLTPGHKGTIEVGVYNVGAASSNGPITVTDTLPPGVEAIEAGELARTYQQQFPEETHVGHERWECSGSTVVTCTSIPAGLPSFAGGGGLPEVAGESEGPLGLTHMTPILDIVVKVAPNAVEGKSVNRVSVAGGGAAEAASSADPLTIASTPAGFGVAGFDGWFSNADGTLDRQAGSHPYAATFEIKLPTALNQESALGSAGGKEPRDIAVSLPPGLVGDPGATPRCTHQELEHLFSANACPGDSQVGYLSVLAAPYAANPFQVFNMVPPRGVPVELGINVLGIITYLDAGVRSGGDYGATTRANNNIQGEVQSVRVTLWGVPGDPSHNSWRTRDPRGCSEFDQLGQRSSVCKLPEANPKAFLTMPVSCEGPGRLSLFVNSWQNTALTGEASVPVHDASGAPMRMGGCEDLRFDPSIGTALDTGRVDSPAGLAVHVHFPLEGFDEPESLVPSDMKDAVVTLPEGLVVNPGQATGLVLCGETEASLRTLPGGGENDGPAVCPAASRVGSARIKSPLLEVDPEKEIEGSVYLLGSNPPDLKLLVAGSADGVNIKSVGTVHMDTTTGRLTATFQNTPQQPVSDIDLSFNGGSRGALITPRSCGVFTTSSDITPWSAPGTPDAFPTAQFGINEGPSGGACPNGEPFGPSAVAGTTSNQAGGFSPLTLTLSRQDGEQDVNGVSVTLPPGLLPVLKGVERCPEPQAAQGTCGANSLIGHTTVAVGAGPDPLYVQGGQVFLTGPYKGAPFGLSVVVPAVAGPFNLGNVVVRAAISIDAHTGQPTIVSDPFPRILDGVPLQIKMLNVTTDRSGFTFNPTNCEPLSITGSVTSTQGATVGLSSRFQAAGCQGLPFKPLFAVSTQAGTSKKQGASLNVRVGSSSSSQANIRSVAVTLPKQLPSRLTTIQQACAQAVFATNPAGCPAGSNIGTATVNTPVLPNPLSGPVYLVSHGGAAFPDVVVILQGEGVTLDLVGSIDIKHGVTSSTFASVPDAPVTSFAMSLPEGPHSALAAVLPTKAKGSLCGTALRMPTTLTGQNGAVLKQNTKIAVTGCPKARKKGRARKRGKARKRKG